MLVDLRLDAELTAVPEQAAALVEAGAAGLFTYEGPRDVFLPLAAAASALGDRADLYTNVAVALPRSPVHRAYAAQDLHRATGGRFALGLGSQVRAHVEGRYGARWESPAAQMREWVLAVKAVQRSWQEGEPLDFRGRWTSHTYQPPMFDPGPLPWGSPPVWLAAVGPRMTAVAAEVADGLLVHPFCTDRSVAELVLPRLAEGTAAAGRSPSDVAVVGQAVVAVGRDEEELATASAAARGLVAFYASTPAYRPVLDVHGWGELQVELRALTKAGRWDDLAAALPDDVADAVVVSGSPGDVAAGLHRRFRGCARVALSVPYAAPLETLRELLDLSSRSDP